MIVVRITGRDNPAHSYSCAQLKPIAHCTVSVTCLNIYFKNVAFAFSKQVYIRR